MTAATQQALARQACGVVSYLEGIVRVYPAGTATLAAELLPDLLHDVKQLLLTDQPAGDAPQPPAALRARLAEQVALHQAATSHEERAVLAGWIDALEWALGRS